MSKATRFFDIQIDTGVDVDYRVRRPDAALVCPGSTGHNRPDLIAIRLP
jgi:hypothetical protein